MNSASSPQPRRRHARAGGALAARGRHRLPVPRLAGRRHPALPLLGRGLLRLHPAGLGRARLPPGAVRARADAAGGGALRHAVAVLDAGRGLLRRADAGQARCWASGWCALDGSPVGLLESAVRNLCRVVDFLPGALRHRAASRMLLDAAAPAAGGPARRHAAGARGAHRPGQVHRPRRRPRAVPAVAPALASGSTPGGRGAASWPSSTRAPRLEPDGPDAAGRAAGGAATAGCAEAERAAVLASPEATEAFLRARVQAER